MANNRENYYIKLVLEAIDKSSPAFAAVEKRLNDLNNEFQKATGYTEDQRKGQERLNEELKISEKRYRDLDEAASSRTKTAKEEIKNDQELANSRINLANAETFLAETLNDVNATEDEIQAARQSRREAETKLIDDAINKRQAEIESELNYADQIEQVNQRIAKTNREIAKLEADRSNMRLKKAKEQETITLAEQKLKDLEAIVDKTNQTITLDNNAFGKKYKSEAVVRGLITKQETEIKRLKSEGIEGDFKGLDYLEGSIRATTTQITGLNDQVKSLRKDLSSLKEESQAKADSLIAGRGIDKEIEGAVQLLSAEQELSAFRNRDFANRREQINQEIDDIERAAEAEAKAVEEKAARRKKIDAENRKAGLAKRDEIRAEEKARDQERRDREDIIKQVILLTKESQKNGAYSSAANKQIRQQLNYLKKAYVDLGGSGRDFQNVINENAKTQSAADNDAIESLYERGRAYDQLVTKLEKYKNNVREARISGDKPGEQIANAQLIATREKLEAEKAIIEKSLSEIDAKVNFDIDQVSEAKLEAVRAAAGRDINIDVNFDADQKGLTLISGLAGAFNAFSEGTDRASRGIAAFDNIIRGLLVLGIALFFEQIILSAIGAVAALTALAASAIAAGSALAGALAAGALQAAPAIGVLAAFANRVSNVFQAVKQANLLQQQESYKGGQAANQQASSLNAVVDASERVKEAQDAVTEARKKAREALQDLIIQEQRQSLALESSQEKLNNATSSFALESAQLDVKSAKNDLSRTRTNLKERRSGGINQSPEVTTALKNLEQAQRALDQARQTSAQTGASVDATTGKLDYLLSNLSSAERRLFKGLVELQNRWRKFAQQVSEPLTNSFVFAIDRINNILKSQKLINVGKSLGESLGQSFKRVFDFILSGETVNRLLAFAEEFKRNLIPLTNIAINLSQIFLDIGEAANPVLATILDYFDKVIAKFANFTGSSDGKNQLAEFFDAGAQSLIKFFDLVGAVSRVILALIGKPGSGMGLDAGNAVLDQLIDGLNKLADDISNPSTKVAQFFKRFFDFAKEVLPLFKPLVVAIGEALDRIFNKQGVEALRGFVNFVSRFVIPAIADFALGVAKVTKIVVDLTDQFPLLGKALQAFIAVALAGSVLGRVNSLLAPFQSLAAYAFIGKGKQSIFKILQADAEAGLPSIKKVIDAWNASDALIKPSRFGIKGAKAAEAAAGPGAASGLAREALPGVTAEAAGAGGIAATASSTVGFLTNPITLVVAGVVALTAAFVGLLAIAGRLDDVIKALGNAFEFVKEEVSNSFKAISNEINNDKNTQEAFREWIKILKSVGNILADLQIKQLKGAALAIATIVRQSARGIVFAIRLFGNIVGFIRNLFNSVKLISSGIKDIFLGLFDLLSGNGSERLKTGATNLGKGIFKALLSPLTLLRGTMGKLFDGIFGKILKQVETAANLIRLSVLSIAEVYNRLPTSLVTGKIDTSGIRERFDTTPELRQRRTPAEGSDLSSGERASGGGSRRVDSRGRRVTRERQSQARQRARVNSEDAEKFLSAFDPETVKLSEEITKKISNYWRTLRREARNATNYVREKLAEIRKDGGKDIDKFVSAAQNDLGRMRRSFRTNFVGIANIVRNQMVNVSNIVANQMQNASMAVFKGARYMKKAINEALDSVGSDTTVTLTLEEPKIKEQKAATGGFIGRADGGWIGNRGERGRDMVPTLLGRGEAVLNWGHQKLVEPALRQTYGFGLDDMFNRTKGYHAGGPTAPGLARGGRGRRNGIYTASVYNDPQGYKGDRLASVPYNWAELGVNGGVGNAFGGLPYKTMIKVSYKGKSVNLSKRDIGSGGPGIGGKIRAVDIYAPAAQRLGIPGLANVFVSFDGKKGSSGTGGTSFDEIIAPKVKGGTKAMRELVNKSVGKMIKAANNKLQREAPMDTGGGYAVPGGSGGPAGLGTFDGYQVAKWIIPILNWARRNGWRGRITSGYRSHAYNVAQGRNYFSNHEGTEYPSGAIDVGGYGAVAEGAALAKVLRGYRGPRKLVWGSVIQDYGHFSARGNAQGGFVGGPIKHYAKGGHVHGPEGKAVPVIAHAGEWILNKAQQARVAAMTGKSINTVRDALGFSGGPMSFKGGGEVKPTEAFKFPFAEKGLGLTNFPDNAKFFDTQLRKFGDAIDKLLSNILSTAGLEKTKKRLEDQIAKLKKGGTTDKEEKQIKSLETQLKNVDRKSAVKKLLDSVRALTGTDGSGGAIGAYYDKIKRTFDQSIAAANMAAAGVAKIGNKLVRGQKIDPVQVAQAQADAQAKLFDDLNKTIEEYSKAVNTLKRASDKIGAKKKTKGPNKGDLIIKDLGTLVKEQRKDQSELDRLEEGTESKKQKERIEVLKKRISQRKKDIDAKNKVELDIKNLEDKRREKEQEAIDAENARLEAEQKAFEERTKQLTRAVDISDAATNFAKSLADLTGNSGGVKSALDALAENAKSRRDTLQQRLDAAQQRLATDPRWQSVVDELQQQVYDAQLAVVQTMADVIDNAVSGIENTFQRAETARGLSDRMAAIAEKMIAGAGNTTRRTNLESKGRDLVTQRDALADLLNDPSIQGNAKQMQDLRDKIAELNVTIAENTQEIKDLNLQIRQQAVERITGISSRTGGLLGNAGSIFENISRTIGQPNTQNQISLANSLRNALGLEGTSLSAELTSFLADPNSGGLLPPEATNVLQQLLSAFNSGDAGSFATVLQSLSPQIALLESTLGESARGPFQSFIDSLVNNTIAVTDNTANLAELNGLANQPQPFSTTAWTRFRAAIFNGIGDVLPQFDVPQMATGGYITKGGLFQLHPGEFVVKSDGSNVDQGDINITVNEANKPLDVTALASRIAFEKRTRK